MQIFFVSSITRFKPMEPRGRSTRRSRHKMIVAQDLIGPHKAEIASTKYCLLRGTPVIV